jgi:hypothetical protein
MKDILDAIVRTTPPKLLLVFGVLLLVASFVLYGHTKDGSTLTMLSSPNHWLFATGISAMILGFGSWWWEEFSGVWITRTKVRKCDDGFVAEFSGERKGSQISVVFGRLEEVATGDGAVALPVNDLFEDACFTDERTVTGAYIAKHFGGAHRSPIMQKLQADARSLVPAPEMVVAEDGAAPVPSFGVGTAVPIVANTAGQPCRIFVAVSTKRAGVGIRSEMASLFLAVTGCFRIMVDKRLETIALPVLGAGKGGLGRELSLLTLVTAFADAIHRTGGQHVKGVKLVVFKPKDGPPEISAARVRRILATGVGMVES